MGSSSISCWELGVGSFEKGGCRGAFEKGEKCNVWIFRALEGCWSFHLYACLHSLETCQQGSFSVVARSALLFASICAQTKFAQDRYARRRDTLEQELKGDQDRSLCLRPGFHFFWVNCVCVRVCLTWYVVELFSMLNPGTSHQVCEILKRLPRNWNRDKIDRKYILGTK